MTIKFGLIGKGTISEKHIKAIESIGGELVQIYDPLLTDNSVEDLFKHDFDYAVICSPSNFHYEHTKLALKNNRKVIVEKPQQLPWEPIIDNDDINVVLQYRWFKPEEIGDKVEIVVKRDEKYFKSWKGNSVLTGGIFFNIFIHYLDLALKFKCPFSGIITTEGNQFRKFGNIDLTSIDGNLLYTKMYEDIVFNDKGVKPKDLFYLDWVMKRCNLKYGMGGEVLNKKIEFDPNNWEN